MNELGWKPEHSSLREIIGSAWQWKRKRLGSAMALSG
jgi:UDP-glucose 4-epimerase